MSQVDIHIDAEFGSEFQRNFAHTSLMMTLRAWRDYVDLTHKKNKITIKINNDNINHLDHFNWNDSDTSQSKT